jgi:molybdenum cofactor biosynthesis enzyme MoaA
MRKNVIFYGAGNDAKNFKSIFEELAPVCFVDNDANKGKEDFMGKKVLPLKQALQAYPEALFYIATSKYKQEILIALLERIEAARIINYETSLPVARSLGEALLSVLALPEDEDAAAWDDVRDIAYGDKAHKFLNALHKGLTSGSFREASRACFGYISALAASKACDKELGLRLQVSPRCDDYVVYTLLLELCACCFTRPETQRVFLLTITETLDMKSAHYAYAVLAKIEMNGGNMEAAFNFLEKAQEIEDHPLYISHLYCEISDATGNKFEVSANTEDLSDYFCPMPFDNYTVVQFDFCERTFNVGICECLIWTPLSVGAAKGWNSDVHQKMRASIHDGSYRYCNRLSCPRIKNRLLVKKEAVTNQRHKDIIAKQLTVIPQIEIVKLEYDRGCNLSCPSCREAFVHNSQEEITALNSFAEAEILPLLKRASWLFLSSSGEALVSPHSLELLHKITPSAYPDLKIGLFTNGSHDLEAAWKRLGDTASLIDICVVSVDGSDQQTFEKLRYPAKWDKLMANMEFLAQLKSSGGLSDLAVRFVVQKDNYRQMAEMLRLCTNWQVNSLGFTRIRKFSMPDEAFKEKNVFASEHPLHHDLIKEYERMEKEREQPAYRALVIEHR